MREFPADPSRALEARFGQGLALHQQGKLTDAERLYQEVLQRQSNHVGALHLLGVIALQTGRAQRGVELIGKAIGLDGRIAEAHVNLGNGLRALKRHDEAIASYDRAIALKPGLADVHASRGNALLDLKRPAEALASYDRAIALNPNLAGAHNNRGNALQDFCRYDEAVASYDRAIALRPEYAEAFSNRGNALRHLKRYEEALASVDRALAIRPDHGQSLGIQLEVAQRICDWTRTIDPARIFSPFPLLAAFDDPSLHLRCAESYVRDKLTPQPPPLWNGSVWRHDRIRIAYLSADFCSHATAYLMAGLLELHDRARFEIVGISFGPDDGSAMRRRMVAAFEKFHEVSATGDREVAKLLNRLEIDIAVDLKGYTQDARAEILAHRPAPIQVSWLGYPGTMAADFIDYVIADPVVLPFDQEKFYTEKIVHLPDCYQVNDAKRDIAQLTPSRREAGLPDRGFVYCCFNNTYKITPPVFDIWMRLLKAVEGSVLWLFRDNPAAERNLCRQAAARGIDPARLVFAERLQLENHLARHRLADLFLDTLPYNAHTTASDALWAGLPVLTCRGQAFAGRVAASLLHAVGLAELITDSLPAYEALALRLATDAALLGGLRARLAENRLSSPLFDTDRFRRHIEAAYLTMWELWQRGERPRGFAVA